LWLPSWIAHFSAAVLQQRSLAKPHRLPKSPRPRETRMSNRSAELEPALRPLTLGHVGFPSHPSERGLNTDSAAAGSSCISTLCSNATWGNSSAQNQPGCPAVCSLAVRLPVLLALLLALTTLAAAGAKAAATVKAATVGGATLAFTTRRRRTPSTTTMTMMATMPKMAKAIGTEGDGSGGTTRATTTSPFLGRDESRRLDEMSPEESQKKLAELFAKMEAWLAEIAHQEREKQAESRFHSIKAAISAKDMNSSLSLRAMHHEVIGDEPADKETEATFAQTMAKDAARWVKADANADKKLDKAEFADFMFAEHSPRMKDVVVQEALNASDKEKREGKKLPKWVVKEEEFFKMNLDLNKDGSLDADEVYKWIVPEDIDHSKRESKHLFEAADEDRDKFLSKDEVMKNWETFVGHRATHYGEFAPSSHDELCSHPPPALLEADTLALPGGMSLLLQPPHSPAGPQPPTAAGIAQGTRKAAGEHSSAMDPQGYVVINLRRHSSDKSWGFAVQGGSDMGLPVFVHKITRNGIAHKSGLEPGDVIVKICQTWCADFSHGQVKAEILRAGNELDFTVKKRGFNVAAYAAQTAPSEQQQQRQSEVSEEHVWRHGGPTFKNVVPKTYQILESQLPHRAVSRILKDRSMEEHSPYLKAQGPTIQRAFGEHRLRNDCNSFLLLSLAACGSAQLHLGS
uniref:PDZ domain-containing protein n=1 Tax=Macrostomum lignano TaxID=282301 RepID=A0A1I8FD57_9PLAT